MREWLSGRNPIHECLRAGRRKPFELQIASGLKEAEILEELTTQAGRVGVPIKRVERSTLEQRFSNSQGVALQVSTYPYVDFPTLISSREIKNGLPLFLILDSLQDPQNLGTLLRSAESFGVHGVIIPQHHSARITPAVSQASSGAVEHLPIVQTNLVSAIEKLKEHFDLWVVGLENSELAQDPAKIRLDGSLGLVVGNEASGLRRLVRKSCDFLMKIPLRGELDSLNAAVAGSIALFLIDQVRRGQD